MTDFTKYTKQAGFVTNFPAEEKRAIEDDQRTFVDFKNIVLIDWTDSFDNIRKKHEDATNSEKIIFHLFSNQLLKYHEKSEDSKKFNYIKQIQFGPLYIGEADIASETPRSREIYSLLNYKEIIRQTGTPENLIETPNMIYYGYSDSRRDELDRLKKPAINIMVPSFWDDLKDTIEKYSDKENGFNIRALYKAKKGKFNDPQSVDAVFKKIFNFNTISQNQRSTGILHPKIKFNRSIIAKFDRVESAKAATNKINSESFYNEHAIAVAIVGSQKEEEEVKVTNQEDLDVALHTINRAKKEGKIAIIFVVNKLNRGISAPIDIAINFSSMSNMAAYSQFWARTLTPDGTKTEGTFIETSPDKVISILKEYADNISVNTERNPREVLDDMLYTMNVYQGLERLSSKEFNHKFYTEAGIKETLRRTSNINLDSSLVNAEFILKTFGSNYSKKYKKKIDEIINENNFRDGKDVQYDIPEIDKEKIEAREKSISFIVTEIIRTFNMNLTNFLYKIEEDDNITSFDDIYSIKDKELIYIFEVSTAVNHSIFKKLYDLGCWNVKKMNRNIEEYFFED